MKKYEEPTSRTFRLRSSIFEHLGTLWFFENDPRTGESLSAHGMAGRYAPTNRTVSARRPDIAPCPVSDIALCPAPSKSISFFRSTCDRRMPIPSDSPCIRLSTGRSTVADARSGRAERTPRTPRWRRRSVFERIHCRARCSRVDCSVQVENVSKAELSSAQ